MSKKINTTKSAISKKSAKKVPMTVSVDKKTGFRSILNSEVSYAAVEKKNKAGEKMFVEEIRIAEGFVLDDEDVKDLHENGFRWFKHPLSIWSRYMNPETGSAVKYLAKKFPNATHQTHEEYAAVMKAANKYYTSPEGIARFAALTATEKPAKKSDVKAEPAAPLKGRAKSVMTQFSNLSEADRKAILAALNA